MPIVTTPYTPSGAIDFDDLAREMRFFDRIGCTGAVWPQASSDVDLMTKEERLHGMTVIAEACRPLKVASILGVQGGDIAQMLDYARHAEQLEPDAVIAMPPSAPELQTVEGLSQPISRHWRARCTGRWCCRPPFPARPIRWCRPLN